VETVVRDDGHWPADVERILASLPGWFGMEEANRGYVVDAPTLPSWAAFDEQRDEVVGVCLVRRHNDVAAEIDLRAVPPELHRRGSDGGSSTRWSTGCGTTASGSSR
jgi:hypothetical protein